MSESRTEIDTLGEFGLIDRLTADLPKFNDTTLLGVGDDAAILSPDSRKMVITTDLLTEGVHFDLTYTPLKHLGYKAIVVNLSDCFAMNAKPEQVTVSIAFSNRFSVEALEELYKGMRTACELYKVDLIGGDTTSSKSGLTISITAIGHAEEGKIVKRATAHEKDLLVVSGDLGGAYMGLQVLEREKTVFKAAPGAQPDLSGFDYILERQLKPEARQDAIEFLAELGVLPTSMIDISDGLASEALHLAKASKLCVTIYEDKIPIDPQTSKVAREFELDPTLCALSGGEDYELLFTVAQADFEKLKGSPHFSVIGYMTDPSEGNKLVDRGGAAHDLLAQGWNAFKQEDDYTVD